jgi:serine/threonine-protein kinase RsbW
MALAEWGLSRLEETVSLLVTELVSNGIRHAQTELELLLTFDGACLRIAVTDGDPRPPIAKARQELAVGGWGLPIVQSLASEWGIDATDTPGKTVWFQIDTTDT